VDDKPVRRRTKPQTENQRFQLVIDRALMERVQAEAARDRRSLSGLIVVLIEEALNRREEKSPGNRAPTQAAQLAA
jgi:hypothetical protein